MAAAAEGTALPGDDTVSALVVATAAAGGAAAAALALLFFDLAAADPAFCTAAVAVLAAGILYFRMPRRPLPEEAGPADAIRAGARALTVAAGASVIRLLPGGDLALVVAEGTAGGTTLLAVYALAVLGAFTGSVLLQLALLDATPPIQPKRISGTAVQVLKPVAVVLVALNVLGNLLVAFR